MVDNGYDISDYRDICPIFGTLAEFQELLEQCHIRGIRVIMDMVLNHHLKSALVGLLNRVQVGTILKAIGISGKIQATRMGCPITGCLILVEPDGPLMKIASNIYFHVFNEKPA